MDATREMASQKEEERLSKDPYCSGYQYQRNILALEVTDEKVHIYDGRKVMPKLIELFEKKQQ